MQAKIGNKVVNVDRIENGVPVIRAKAERTVYPNGRVDVKVKVPCLTIQSRKT